MRVNADELLKQDSYLKTNIANMISIVNKKSGYKFTSFLDDRQQELARSVLRNERWESYCFYGGHDDCERCMLGVFSPEYEEYPALFPIRAISLKYSEKAGKLLNHRDFLGSLMNLQIKREAIGDIWTDSGSAVVFVKGDIAEFLLQNLIRVGNVTVSTAYVDGVELVRKQEFKQLSGTVPSLRLDCVISMLSGKGRAGAVELITSGNVKVEHLECTSVSKQLKGTETIAIRGMGKFILTGEQKKTKKDRIFISANHML